MSVFCFLLRRKFVSHLEGELTRSEAGRLDAHLARCSRCREIFKRVRSGHEAGRRFGRLEPARPPRLPEFEEMWRARDPAPGGRIRDARPERPVIRAMSSPLATRILWAALLAQSVFLVVSHWDRIFPRSRGFTPLPISEFAMSSGARVYTEGFVRNVYFDDEERTLHIKLAEGPGKPEPFVICEIRDPHGVNIPSEGSRIRVYGTARYDGQPGRGWHEVNPVTDISVLKR